MIYPEDPLSPADRWIERLVPGYQPRLIEFRVTWYISTPEDARDCTLLPASSEVLADLDDSCSGVSIIVFAFNSLGKNFHGIFDFCQLTIFLFVSQLFRRVRSKPLRVKF